MSLSFCVLGSGSAGNCTVVALGGASSRESRRMLLIDMGLSPRQTALRLGAVGVRMDAISDVLLTHLDGDHLHSGWIAAAERFGLRLHLHEMHVGVARGRGVPRRVLHPFDGQVSLPGVDAASTSIEAIRFPHDELGTSGFIISHRCRRLGFATDLGHAPPRMFERFIELDALAIESNYDRDMQLSSRRPLFLKQRIMGGAGHLSNEQSLDAVLRLAERSALRHVALLHLSQQCNHPRKIRELYGRRAPHLLLRVTITSQRQATGMIDVGRAAANHQAELFEALPSRV